MLFAEMIVYGAFTYLALGGCFAVWFVILGVSKLDEATHGTGIGFRFLIFWGATVFWIMLAIRLGKGEKRPLERNAHRVRSGDSA